MKEYRRNPFWEIPRLIRNRIPHRMGLLMRKMLCRHTHTFSYYMRDAHWHNYAGKDMGEHGGLKLEGCYLCGRVRVRDYHA